MRIAKSARVSAALIGSRTLLALWLAGAAACSSSTEPSADAGDEDSGVHPDAAGADAASPSPDAAAPDAMEVDAGDTRPIHPAWTQLTGAPPTPMGGRWGSPMVYVPAERRFLLFGGSNYPRGRSLADTWSYSLDDSTWSEVQVTSPPPPRYCHALLYLPDQNQVLLVGGRNDNGPLPAAAWTFDLASSTWEAIAGPTPVGVIGPVAAWMPDYPGGGRAVVFGGATATAVKSETWAYDPTARAFERVTTSSVPPGRGDSILAYDPGPAGGHGRVLLYGGVTQLFPAPNHLHDTWSFDGTDWRHIPQAVPPQGRRSIGSAFDPSRREWVMFSGTIEDDDLLDLWVFDARTDTWVSQSTDGAPGPRGFAAFAYAPDAETYFVFGGLASPNYRSLEDGWSLRLRDP